MPIYQYGCPSCQHEFEGIYKFEEDVPCEKCGAMTKKVPTNASFKIKGFRAANRYGRDFIDTPGKDLTTGEESGYSYTSRTPVAEPIDHNQGNR
jgi:putative FmdB family regulatory protein